jgi:hypothetical protein
MKDSVSAQSTIIAFYKSISGIVIYILLQGNNGVKTYWVTKE